MTYTLTLTPYLAAQLAACCLHAGLDVRNIFPAHLTRHTAPTPAVTAAVEEPADICPPRVPLPVAAAQAEKWKPAPPSLTRPGDILEAPEDIDWDDPALYV